MKKFGTEDRQSPQPAASAEPARLPPPRAQLRLAATLTFAGFVVSVIAGLFHADSANANDHPATFAEYARSGIWTAVHLGQFAGMALLIAGLLVLLVVLTKPGGSLVWTARFGAAAAVAALALYAALQAVDGVALKQAVTPGPPPRNRRKRFGLPPPRACGGWSGACAATRAWCWGRPWC